MNEFTSIADNCPGTGIYFKCLWEFRKKHFPTNFRNPSCQQSTFGLKCRLCSLIIYFFDIFRGVVRVRGGVRVCDPHVTDCGCNPLTQPQIAISTHLRDICSPQIPTLINDVPPPDPDHYIFLRFLALHFSVIGTSTKYSALLIEASYLN